ncbi:MAG: hydrogenase nickel incorporation protein HypB [Methylococcaceae bacterium]
MCADCGCGLAPYVPPVAGFTPQRLVRIEQDVLGQNDALARENRMWLAQHSVLALNLLSSPGSGKTSLLERTLIDLQGEIDFAVVEGDQQTTRDAERIRATGIQAVQINTGKGCHLDARQIGQALTELTPGPGAIVFIENVGNLVCPALFDLGEAGKVVILSVTEGEDKPIKYPDMFHRAALVIINKIDLLPYLDFDLDACLGFLRQVNPDVPVLNLSVTQGSGLSAWYDWLREQQSRVSGR